MQLFHNPPVWSVVYDEPSLVAGAGFVAVMALALRAGLRRLVDAW
jgi:hypothetical protein